MIKCVQPICRTHVRREEALPLSGGDIGHFFREVRAARRRLSGS
jgi:hypothetical protein